MTNLQEKRIAAHLSSLIRFQGLEQTRAEMVQRLIAQGGKFEAREEPKVKPLSRMAFFRADNHQQRAHEKRMKEGGMKTVHICILPDGVFYDVTKIQYDYALGS